MLAPRTHTEPVGSGDVDQLRQRVKVLQAQLSADADSYREIISTMAATCRTLQARVRTLEVERLQSVAEVEWEPSWVQGYRTSAYPGGHRRRVNSRSLSWPISREEAEELRRGHARSQSVSVTSGSPVEIQTICASPVANSPDRWSGCVSLDTIIFEKACQAWF